MFLRARTRLKDGKRHRYWSIVENRRAAWCQSVEALSTDGLQRRQIAILPNDRNAPALE